MGKAAKKKSLKRQARKKRIENNLNLTNDSSFGGSVHRIKKHLIQFNAVDAAIALLTSELWLSNVTSPIKHQLAWRILISIPIDEFKRKRSIDSYQEFKDFTKTLHSLLPNLPMLEDYHPQNDWGEITHYYQRIKYKIFYGGSIERINDFITAFEIVHSDNHKALRDMELALATQHHFIDAIPRSIFPKLGYISSGHISIPSEQFWRTIQRNIRDYSISMAADNSVSEYLVVKNEDLEQPMDNQKFGDDILTGQFQKFLFYSVEELLFPVSLRNATNTIMTIWNDEETDSVSVEQLWNVSQLVFGNIKHSLPSPFCYLKDQELQDIQYANCLMSNKNLYVIIPICDLDNINEVYEQVKDNLLEDKVHCFQFTRSNQIVKLPRCFGIESESIKVLFVNLIVPTVIVPSFLQENVDAEVLSLPDFISLCSSVSDADELDEFYEFSNSQGNLGIMTGIFDRFAAYKESHSVLIDGANSPDNIIIDPHLGCSWRYDELKKYNEYAPKYLPDYRLNWLIESHYDKNVQISAKSLPISSWFTQIGNSEIHFCFDYTNQKLDLENLKIMSLAQECFCDSLSQRAELIQDLPVFISPLIIVSCSANEDTLIDSYQDLKQGNTDDIYDWSVRWNSNNQALLVDVSVNISKFAGLILNAIDSKAQVNCVIEFISTLCSYLDLSFPDIMKTSLEETKTRTPRMTLSQIEKNIDVPEITNFVKTEFKSFKLARKELALTFKKLGIAPGKYLLKEAKKVIDEARDSFRTLVHLKISSFERVSFITNCIEQHENLSTEYKRESFRVKQSLSHEVTYDRNERQSSLHEEFTRNSKSYRYLLEVFLSSPDFGSLKANVSDIAHLAGYVDWLKVLYDASDVLHNDVDVGGIVIDEEYVPEVFYDEKRMLVEESYKNEQSNIKLGLGQNKVDQLVTSEDVFKTVDDSFQKEFGFSLQLFFDVLDVLSKWSSVSKSDDLAFHYVATREKIINSISSVINEDNKESIALVVDFITLKEQKIRQLVGKDIIEGDVPVWEHTKRSHRYTIRPLVVLDSNRLIWGADAADKASTIWFNSITNGYLPTDLESNLVSQSLRKLKESLELQLESLANSVVSRFTPFCQKGIDFKRRFPKENFEDVGDFDVLAYWPEANLWLTAECKYIQPPFCFKDAKRLRDKMFDNSKSKSHLCKIKKRRDFLNTNKDRLRELLGWPAASNKDELPLLEMYISKDTYWWMFAPPYKVPTKFVQIDMFESWLKRNLPDDVAI